MTTTRLNEWSDLIALELPSTSHPSLVGYARLLQRGMRELISALQEVPGYAETVSPEIRNVIPQWLVLAGAVPDSPIALELYGASMRILLRHLIQAFHDASAADPPAVADCGSCRKDEHLCDE